MVTAEAQPSARGRSAGLLLHPTSLPGGRLGPEAYRFVDWLVDAGQAWWQVLPLGPPDRHGSPYASASAFAAWPGLLPARRRRVSAAELARFRDRAAYWIGDWERRVGPEAVREQARFDAEWASLRRYAAQGGVRILGDVPINVARDSVDVEAHPELFRRDVVSGAPPDAFSATGQLWGTAVHDWHAQRREGFRWWIERFRRTRELVDMARIDHFRALVAGWEVPAGARTARGGRWRRGPGGAPIEAARAELAEIPLVAEDLGVITPAVERLRVRLGLPGMRVLQFGFGPGRPSAHHPSRHQRDCVVYTGTHDHPTASAWLQGLDARARSAVGRALREAGIDEAEPARALVRLALASPAMIAVAPVQDVLALGAAARMNTPGRERGNWRWRLARGQLTTPLAHWLREATVAAGRAGGPTTAGAEPD